MFVFKGNWETEIELQEFSFLNEPKYSLPKSIKLEVVSFNLKIFDVRNENPDPEIFQLNTVNYLLNTNNQKAILHNLLKYSVNVIYPHYQEFISREDDPDSFPQLVSIEDLSDVYKIDRILIKAIEKEDFSYYIFECSSCLDIEHGITITLYKDEVIDHGQQWDDQKVCEHKGIDYQTYYDASIKEYNDRILELASPHPKYNKLKPFQAEQNEYYPFGLYHTEQEDRLIKELQEKKILNAEYTISRLLELSIRDNKESLTEYLLTLNPNRKHSAFIQGLSKDRFDILDRLIDLGYDPNEYVGTQSTFYSLLNDLVKKLTTQSDYRQIAIRLKYLKSRGLDPLRKDKRGRNSYYGIERIESKDLKNKVITALKQLNLA